MSNGDVKEMIASVLLTEAEIRARVKDLGAEIEKDYAGKELMVIGVLKGAVPFVADLVRAINLPLRYDFIAVSSYGSKSVSSGAVRLLKDLDFIVENLDVLLVEDIVDTGLTLKYLRENMLSRRPRSLKIATLLDKPERRQVQIEPDYCGFSVPDEFLVGYGLDYNQDYRNLPYVAVLKPAAYS
jgi:hypoxanthine phosphoribosyltransferase